MEQHSTIRVEAGLQHHGYIVRPATLQNVYASKISFIAANFQGFAAPKYKMWYTM